MWRHMRQLHPTKKNFFFPETKSEVWRMLCNDLRAHVFPSHQKKMPTTRLCFKKGNQKHVRGLGSSYRFSPFFFPPQVSREARCFLPFLFFVFLCTYQTTHKTSSFHDFSFFFSSAPERRTPPKGQTTTTTTRPKQMKKQTHLATFPLPIALFSFQIEGVHLFV